MPGARRDQRFECSCGAQIVYTDECPREFQSNPRCICGAELQPIADAGR